MMVKACGAMASPDHWYCISNKQWLHSYTCAYTYMYIYMLIPLFIWRGEVQEGRGRKGRQEARGGPVLLCLTALQRTEGQTHKCVATSHLLNWGRTRVALACSTCETLLTIIWTHRRNRYNRRKMVRKRKRRHKSWIVPGARCLVSLKPTERAVGPQEKEKTEDGEKDAEKPAEAPKLSNIIDVWVCR